MKLHVTMNFIKQLVSFFVMLALAQNAVASDHKLAGEWYAVYACSAGYSGETEPYLTSLRFENSSSTAGQWSSSTLTPSRTRRGQFETQNIGSGQAQISPVAPNSDHTYIMGVPKIGQMRLARAGSVLFGIGGARCTSVIAFNNRADATSLFEILSPGIFNTSSQTRPTDSCGNDVQSLARSVASAQSVRQSTRWNGPSGFLTNFDTATARQYLFLNAMNPRIINASFGRPYSKWNATDRQKFSATSLRSCPNNLRGYLADQSFGTPYSLILRSATTGAPWQNLLLWEHVGPALDTYSDLLASKIAQAQTVKDLSEMAMDWNSVVDLLPADKLKALSQDIAARLPELQNADKSQAGIDLLASVQQAIKDFEANERARATSIDDFAILINMFQSGPTGQLYKKSDPKGIALAHMELVPYLVEHAIPFFERDSQNIARSGDYATVMAWKEDQAVFLDLVAYSHGERLEALHAANIADIVSEQRQREVRQAELAQLKERRSELDIDLAQLKYKRGNWNGWSKSTDSTDSYLKVFRIDYNQGEKYQTSMSCHNIFDNAAIRIQSTILDRDTVNWKADSNNQVRIKIVTPSGQSIRRVDLESKADTRSKTTYVNSFYFILTDVDDRRATTKYRNPDVWATGPLAKSLFLMAFSPVSLEQALQSSSYKVYGEIVDNGVSAWVLLAEFGNKSEGGVSDFYKACDFSDQVTP